MQTETKLQVQGYHTDLFGHVNHIRYLEFLENGRSDYFRDDDIFSRAHNEANLVHAMVDIRLRYRRSVSMGAVLRVETNLCEASRIRVGFFQRIFQEDDLVLEAESFAAFISADNGRPARLSKELTEQLVARVTPGN